MYYIKPMLGNLIFGSWAAPVPSDGLIDLKADIEVPSEQDIDNFTL